MKRLLRYWDHYWFEGSGSLEKENLALFRIFFYFLLIPIFYFSATHSPSQFDELFYQPVFFFKAFTSIHESIEVFDLAKYGFYIFAFFSALGFITPISNKIAALCAFYVYAPVENYGGYQHLGSTLLIAMLVMAFAKSYHSYSVDAWLAKRANLSWLKFHAPASEYIWPLKLIQFIWCFIFFSSAVLKISASGADWLRFNMLGLILERFDFLYKHNRPDVFSTFVREFIRNHDWLGRLGTLSTMVLEFSMPLILFSRRSVLPLMGFALVFLFSMMIIMGHHFWYTLSPYLLGILFAQINVAKRSSSLLRQEKKW